MGIAFSRTTHAPFSGRTKLFRLYTFKDEKKTKKSFFRPKNYFSSEKITFPKKVVMWMKLMDEKSFFGRKGILWDEKFFPSKKLFFV
jgi:hypothetical protein